MPDVCAPYERLTERRTLVRFDGRNLGMSERGTALASLDDFPIDFESVVDRAGLRKFDVRI
jgi:hypothetical protein